jgi:predicted transcriptional regulator
MERVDVIKKLIEETGLSTKSFAEKADIPYTTLRSILERGVENASVVNVIKICKALGITVEDMERMASSDELDRISTLAAHHEGEEWTEEELEEIEEFKRFVLMKRKDHPTKE